MRLLLDTHVFLWWAEDNRKLKKEIRKVIASAEAVFVSAASLWEVNIKSALGKVEVKASLVETVDASGFAPLSIDFHHAERVKTLPRLHSDPFDRMLVAQAQIERLRLVSHDRVLETYPVDFLLA